MKLKAGKTSMRIEMQRHLQGTFVQIELDLFEQGEYNNNVTTNEAKGMEKAIVLSRFNFNKFQLVISPLI